MSEDTVLWNPYLGIYLVMTFFDDGSVIERYVPLGPIIFPMRLELSEFSGAYKRNYPQPKE